MTDERARQTSEESCRPQECPFASLASLLGDCLNKESEAYKHFTQSRLELLKGIRALVDKHISGLEEKLKPRKPAKATKIKVE